MKQEKITNRKQLIIALIIYYVIFYLIWAMVELVLSDKIKLLNNDILFEFIKEGILKCLIWILPAVVLCKHFDQFMYIKKDSIYNTKINWVSYLPLFILFTVYALVGSYTIYGKITINKAFGVDDIVWLLFVGITEEMVFRGWLLNSTISENRKWTPIIINNLLFLLIHFPVWINEGCFIENMVTGSFIIIVVLGIIFSYSFIKSKNILVPIVLHMFYDFIITLFCY